MVPQDMYDLSQCDQMARLQLNIGPFAAMKICPKHEQFAKQGHNFAKH